MYLLNISFLALEALEKIQKMNSFSFVDINQLVLDHVPVYIFWKDRDGIYLGCNMKFAKGAGFDEPAELIGKTDYEMPWTKEEADYYVKIDQEVMSSGEPQINFEEPQTTPEGNTIWLRTSKIPLKTMNGNIVGILGTYEDITQRKMQAIALEEQANELKKLNSEMEEFTYITSHDLQEPLNTILTFAKRFEQAEELNDNQKKMAGFMSNSASRMSEMIKATMKNLLLNCGGNATETDTEAEIKGVIQELNSKIVSTKAQITVGNLPTIKVYRSEFHQLLQNLISNALKFARPDVSPIVNITAVEEDDYYRFTVEDNGIGIEEKHYDRVFKVFQRLHSRSAIEGHGIGLANCKKIVAMHNGHIHIESVVGEGSKFIFTIAKAISPATKEV